MSYIVLDLEWNQAMSSKASIFNYLPIHLIGEIIQIGAVRLDEQFCPADEFQADVKPLYFRRMHYKVKKLTGIDKERLSQGEPFPSVFDRFRAWCGEDAVFLTWGYDDRHILEQNIIIHDLDWDWISRWMNVQLIYNRQTLGDRNQKSLVTAMEHFEIEQTRTAHDALGDAYNTALVCSKLDMDEGLTNYEEAVSFLGTRLPEIKLGADTGEALEHRSFSGYAARSEAFADDKVAEVNCADCGKPLLIARWINQGDRRYMTLASCEEHGKFLVRLKFRKATDDLWAVNRILYRADEEQEKFYREKAVQARRHGHAHRKTAKPTRLIP